MISENTSTFKTYDIFFLSFQEPVKEGASAPAPGAAANPQMAVAAMGCTSPRMLRTLLVTAIICLSCLVYLINPDSGQVEVEIPDALQRAVGRRILESEKHSEDFHIVTTERLKFQYVFSGWMFNEKGRTYKVSKHVETSLVHSFTPYVEREAAKRFLDPPHNNIFFANSPAVIWHKGELILVSRIWLDREKYEPKKDWPANQFADNFLYTQKFDRFMKPITNGSIIGIPAPKQWWVGDGPIEPRLMKVKGKVYITFNAAMAFGYEKFLDFTIMWDLQENLPIIPKIKGGSPMFNATEPGDMPRDKHWMALVQNDELFFVHKFDPLRIMHCSIIGYCEFLRSSYKEEFIFKDVISHLRGGTPFEHYEGSYYISIAHSTMYKSSNNHRFYAAHLVVMHVKPYRVVYVSDDIQVHPQIYRDAPMVRPRWIEDGFIFPVSLVIEDKDSIIIGVHVNDFSSVLLRMRGVKALMEEIIQLDKRQMAKGGPPLGYLHKHVHDSLENITRIKFEE